MARANLAKSFLNATKGVFGTIKEERNIKIQLVLGFMAITLAILLEIQKIYLLLIIFVSFLVIILELLNAVIERLIDSLSSESNHKIGKIKDTMAGVVLVSAVLSVITGLLILYNPLIELIKSDKLILLPIILLASIVIILIYINKHFKSRQNKI